MMRRGIVANRGCQAQAGFSLVEILVAMVLMGIVVTAIFNLYLGTERSADTQDRIADVQQNVRFALDQVVRDIRMAGFAMPIADNAITGGPSTPTAGNPFTMRTGSSSDKVLRIKADFTSPASAATVQTITIDSEEVSGLFAKDELARIIRRDTQHERIEGAVLIFTDNPSGSEVKLKGFTTATEFKEGDLIVHTVAGATNPMEFSYWLEGGEIRRSINGGTPRVLGQGISGFQLSYLFGREDEAASLDATTLDDVRAVRVTIVGEATTRDGVKSRTVSSVVQLRNRNFEE
ncbi:MAG: PilW family protein [Trichloromonadaceae bacterium]